MHYFTVSERNYGISFHHEGKKKPTMIMNPRTGEAMAVGSHPKRTECTIFLIDDHEKAVVSKGSAKVVPEVSEVVSRQDLQSRLDNLGRKLIRVVRPINGDPVITYRGDNFSYPKARKLSLQRALEDEDYDFKKAAWEALLRDTRL